jgi:hypothetical protein
MATGSDLSIIKGVLLYKQLICLTMHNACSVRKLHVIQPKCLHIAANTLWVARDKEILEDLGVPVFTDIRTLAGSFTLLLAGVGNP